MGNEPKIGAFRSWPARQKPVDPSKWKKYLYIFGFCSWKQRRIFISKSWIVCRYSISHSLSNTSSSTYTHTPAHTTSRTDTHSHTLTLIHHGFWNSEPYVLVESWALIFSFQALFKPSEAKQRKFFFLCWYEVILLACMRIQEHTCLRVSLIY